MAVKDELGTGVKHVAFCQLISCWTVLLMVRVSHIADFLDDSFITRAWLAGAGGEVSYAYMAKKNPSYLLS